MKGTTALDLLGNGWRLRGSEHDLPASLPGCALQALHSAGLVPDPLYRYNEIELRWVALQQWTFERQVDISDSLLQAAHVDLLLSGVDTIAEVKLNDEKLLSTDNAFRQYRAPVRGLLRRGSNTLSITIQPAITEAEQRAAAAPYVVPSVQGPGMGASYNRLRKPACDAGWDWGPQFSPSGISGRVELSAYSHAHLIGACTRQDWQPDGSVELTVFAEVVAAAAGDCGVLEVSAASCNIAVRSTVTLPDAGVQRVSVKVTVGCDVKLWWPRGYGEPVLHDLQVSFTHGHAGATGDGSASSSISKRIGFKRVELVREPLPDGETFFFKVNGTPIFVKGSNIIPSDVFRSRETPEKERALVRDAAAANMNTLRVWGGGHYPSDALMEACDEAGLLVWLELMFGCAMYPRDAAFLANVAEEVRQQMFRLAGHASTLVLGGNNEVENAFDWFPESRNNGKLYAVDFTALFVDTVRPLLAETGLIYLDSSPSNGVVCEEPYVKRWGNTQDPRFGDVHFYDYASDVFDPRTYPCARFVSEFGFQSFPSFPGYSAQTAPEDWAWDSEMSQHRQRHPNGQQELVDQLRRHFRLGDALQPTERGFRRWVYLTQLQQAWAYDAAVRYWRRIKHAPDARTMGVLYWQHNDIWAGPSWSSINYDGSWKLVHHVAARFFAPLLVSAELDADRSRATVHVNSDVPAPVSGELTVEVIGWAATEAMQPVDSVLFSLPALGSQAVWSVDVAGLWPQQLGSTDVFLRITATATPAAADGAVPDGADATYRSSTELWLSEFKDAALEEPGLSLRNFVQVAPGEVAFELHSAAVAAGVALETPLAGRFSDNCLLVLPWEPLKLRFHAAGGGVGADDLQCSLSIVSVYSPPDGATDFA